MVCAIGVAVESSAVAARVGLESALAHKVQTHVAPSHQPQIHVPKAHWHGAAGAARGAANRRGRTRSS